MSRSNERKLKVIDLFCGIGGLSHGLIKEDLNVVAGIDNDNSCRFGYEYNNKAKFIHKDIRDVRGEEINALFGDQDETIRVLVGCAPCQAFSKLNLKQITEKHTEPLEKFTCLIEKILPDIVSMENVRGLTDTKKHPVFRTFINTLDRCDYKYKWEIVNVSDYGVPQNRRRLVVLASRLGYIRLMEKTHKYNKVTVQDAIKDLEPIAAGEISKSDPLHRARKLTPINLRRIKATPHDGGDSRNWDEDLILACHKKTSGKTYRRSVYGRMYWDKPAPTITTQCTGLGNGRYGHPEQNRAISLREAAIFQSFPKRYRFMDPNEPIVVARIAKFIGNAVPVKLGEVIGKSIKDHVKEYAER